MENSILRVLMVCALALIAVPAVGAVNWTITDATVMPAESSDGSTGTVLAHIEDEDGEPVAADHCSVININYDYPNTAVDEPLTELGTAPGWFIGSNLVLNGSESSLTLYASGTCDGTQTSSSATEQLSFAPDGNISVDALTDLSATFVGGQNHTIRWNATESVGNTSVEEYANMSYTVYNASNTVVSSGAVLMQNGAYEATISFPATAGTYVLSTHAHNTSLNYVNPYGGSAAAIDVDSPLQGDLNLAVDVDRCSPSGALSCEKGTQVTVQYWETAGEPETVNGTVRGTGDFTGDNAVLEALDLSETNDTVWETTFTIPSDLDTRDFGEQLVVNLSAENSLSETSVGGTINVSRFEVIESTEPFTMQGSDIDVKAGPIFPHSELPISKDQIDEVSFTVTDPNDDTLKETTYDTPFNDSIYNAENRLFLLPLTIAQDAPVGSYTVNASITDDFDVTASTEFSFNVLNESSDQASIVVQGIGGGLNPDNLTKVYNTTGVKTEKALLKNTGDDPALVSVHFEGGIANVATLQQSEPVAFASGQLKTLNMDFDLDQAQEYTGTIRFRVHGSYVTNYNLSVPVSLTVNQSCQYRLESICLSDIPAETTITEPGATTLTFTATNEDDAAIDVTTSMNGNLSQVATGDTTSVPANGTVTGTVDVDVDAQDSDTYIGDITFETLYDLVDVPVTVIVDIATGSLNASTESTSIGSYVAGNAVSVPITVENTGAVNISELDFSSSTLDISSNRTVDLAPNASETFTLSGTAPAGDGSVSATVRVTSGREARTSVSYTLSSYDDISEDISSLRTSVDSFRSRLNNLSDIENRSQIEDQVDRLETLQTEADQAWENANYETATSKLQEAQEYRSAVTQDLQQVETAQQAQTMQTQGGGDLPLIPIMVVFLIIVVVGVVLYLSIVPEEEVNQGGY